MPYGWLKYCYTDEQRQMINDNELKRQMQALDDVKTTIIKWLKKIDDEIKMVSEMLGSAFTPVPADYIYDGQHGRGVSWRKHKGKWRLCVINVHKNNHREYIPVDECSVNMKLAILGEIHNLMNVLIENTAKFSEEVRAKVERMEDENCGRD